MTAIQDKILQDSFTTEPENRTVTDPYRISCCTVKAQHSPIGIHEVYVYLHQQRIWLQLFSDQQQFKYILKILFVLHSPDFENCSIHV